MIDLGNSLATSAAGWFALTGTTEPRKLF